MVETNGLDSIRPNYAATLIIYIQDESTSIPLECQGILLYINYSAIKSFSLETNLIIYFVPFFFFFRILVTPGALYRIEVRSQIPGKQLHPGFVIEQFVLEVRLCYHFNAIVCFYRLHTEGEPLFICLS